MSMIIDGTNGLTFNNATTQASAGVVLQVVSATKLNSFSTSSTSLVDVTDLTVSITPKFSTSKILVLMNVKGTSSNGTAGSSDSGVTLVRGTTPIAVGTSGTNSNFTGQLSGRNLNNLISFSSTISYLDSPATTSATTYKVQARAAAGTIYINIDEGSYSGSASSITVMEIAQ